MKTYKLGSIDLYNPQTQCFCVLGVYLAEKHPEIKPEDYSKEVTEWGDACAYQHLEKHCGDDMRKMSDVIAGYEVPGRLPASTPRNLYGHVYSANDRGAPKEILKEALAAVGVAVELEDERDLTLKDGKTFWERLYAKEAVPA